MKCSRCGVTITKAFTWLFDGRTFCPACATASTLDGDALRAACRDRLDPAARLTPMPCGCVMCDCPDDERCHGCGAKESPACYISRTTGGPRHAASPIPKEEAPRSCSTCAYEKEPDEHPRCRRCFLDEGCGQWLPRSPASDAAAIDESDLTPPTDLEGLARVLQSVPRVESMDHLLDVDPASDAATGERCEACGGTGALRDPGALVCPTCPRCGGSGRASTTGGGAK